VQAAFASYADAKITLDPAMLLEAVPVNTETVQFIQRTNVRVLTETPISENVVDLGDGRFKIYSGHPFYKLPDGWEFTETATTTRKSFDSAVEATMAESAWYFDAWPEVKVALAQSVYPSVDASYTYTSGSKTWAEVRDASTATYMYSTETDAISWVLQIRGSSEYSHLGRGLLCFDGSSLTDGNIVDSGTVYVKAQTPENTGGQGAVVKIGMTNYANDVSSPAMSDYAKANFTSTASDTFIAANDWTNNSYKEWSLNASGKSQVDTTGIFCYGFRSLQDMTNSDVGVEHDVRFPAYNSEYTGTANDPYIAVTLVTPTPTPTPTPAATSTPTPTPTGSITATATEWEAADVQTSSFMFVQVVFWAAAIIWFKILV